ncbi:lysoplasmalogenase [Aureibaculum sp. A20]|uniref:Lysoplasmalogenase n=1 Tax=Aureibaculum flavum TaxID=2795986 RepID=A0ABS0WSW4_9FLAO|nr:lysoplasmalogenase [Aureibaculum flavum]MBJ2175079.1 lysoplasmalogenase [Aureibaculum flavum]
MATTKNINKVTIITTLFVMVSLCDMVGVVFNIELLRSVFKPMLMLTLLTLYVVSMQQVNGWYVGALVFSFFGDVLLLFEGELYFMLGLISFLIAHIIYIKIVLGWINTSSLKTILIATIPFLLVFFALINLLKNSLNELFVPVVVYGITISVMGIVSLLFYLNRKSVASKYMFMGACLFIISDSVLAINKFYTTNNLFPIIIMLTYLAAQYLILRAVLTHAKTNK